MERIKFGRRFGAYILDGLFIFVISFVLVSIVPSFLENLVDWSKINSEQIITLENLYGDFANKFIILIPAYAISGFFYNLLEGFTGYTIAKLILGIQVGNQDGTKANQSKLMLRFAIKNISVIINLIVLITSVRILGNIGSLLGLIIIIGCLAALNEQRLALHDIIAKTALYKKNQLANNQISL